MKNHLRQVRNAVMAVLPFFGRFGSSKDTEPESFMPPIKIEGGGPGKSASRKRNHRRHGWKAGITADIFLTRERQEQLFAAIWTFRELLQLLQALRVLLHLYPRSLFA